MFIIAHKENNEAYKKRLQDLQLFYTSHGIDFYYQKTNNKWDDMFFYYYTVHGIDGLLQKINVNIYCPPQEVKTTLELIAKDGERFNKTFFDVQGLLTDIKNAVNEKEGTSNADAFLCELAGDFDLAELVRRNRAEYIEKQEENNRKKYAEECARQAEEEKENARKQAEAERQATTDFANNKAIDVDMFLSLCKHNNIVLPIKTIGYIKDNVSYVYVRIENGEPRYVYAVNDKKRKSQSLFGYIEKLYTAIKQTK